MRGSSTIHRALRSSSLAVATLIALAATAAAGSVLEHLYSSSLFLGIVALLAVNVSFCTLHRFSKGGARIRGMRGATDLAVHVSLLLVMAGGAAKSVFGRVLTQNVAVGTETGTMYDWRTGRDEPLGYTLRIDAFRVERYPLQVAVGVRRVATGEKVGLVELREGRTARVPDAAMELAEPSYDPSAGLVTVTLRSPAGERRLSFPARPGEEESPEAGGHSFVLVAWRSEVRAARAEASIIDGGRRVARGILEPNGSFSHGGTSFFMTAWGTDQFGIDYCGIQAARDPGAPLFWAGCILLALAAPLHVASRARRGAAASGLFPGNAEDDDPDRADRPGA